MDRPYERDTAAEARRILIEGLRQMTPSQKLARVVALNRSVEELARAGIRLRNPEASERQIRFLLARLWLPEATIHAVANLIGESS